MEIKGKKGVNKLTETHNHSTQKAYTFYSIKWPQWIKKYDPTIGLHFQSKISSELKNIVVNSTNNPAIYSSWGGSA